MSDDHNDEHRSLYAQRRSYVRNLEKALEKAAKFGDMHIPTPLANEIDDFRAKIAEIDAQLLLLRPMIDENLRSEAFYTFMLVQAEQFTGDLTEAAHLLQQVVDADPTDQDNRNRLGLIRRFQRLQKEYAAIGRLREAGNRRGVELALDDFARRAPDYPDVADHHAWLNEVHHPSPPQAAPPAPPKSTPPEPSYPPYPALHSVEHWNRVKAQLEVLENPDLNIMFPQRLQAADQLAALGDPRYPRTVEEWEQATSNLSRTFTEQGVHYWRYVEGGRGMSRLGTTALQPFWIARFPITVAQFEPFVHVGYGPQAQRWWTKHGVRWKRKRKRVNPWHWHEIPFAQLNQPVIGVMWYEARAFVNLLTEQLAALLPPDYVIRLPTEAEWEVTAAWEGCTQREYPWGNQPPIPERAVYDASGIGHPAPVGTCAPGMAACGALDMAGNVGEWTQSTWQAENKAYVTEDADDYISLHGGSYDSGSIYLRCRERVRGHSSSEYLQTGFRCCIAPRSYKRAES